MTQANEATSNTNCPQKTFDPYLETLKDIATKSGETHFHTDWCEIFVTGQNFLGGIPSNAIYF